MNIRIIVARRTMMCAAGGPVPGTERPAGLSGGGDDLQRGRAVEAALAMEFDVILLDIEMETIRRASTPQPPFTHRSPRRRSSTSPPDNDDMILTAMAHGRGGLFRRAAKDEWLFEHIRMAYAGNPTMVSAPSG